MPFEYVFKVLTQKAFVLEMMSLVQSEHEGKQNTLFAISCNRCIRKRIEVCFTTTSLMNKQGLFQGVRNAPSPFWETPKLHKKGKERRTCLCEYTYAYYHFPIHVFPPPPNVGADLGRGWSFRRPPNSIKRRKTVSACVQMQCVLIVNCYLYCPPPPLSKIL